MDERDPFSHLPPVSPRAPASREPDADPFAGVDMAKFVAEERARQAPKGPQGVLENAADIGGAGLAGVGRGLVSLPGIVGDIGQIYERSPAYAAWVQNRVQELRGKAEKGAARKAYEERLAPIEARMTPEEKAGMEYTIGGVKVPTGQKMVEKAAPYVPGLKYEGQTPPARVVGTIGEFVGQIPATSLVSGVTRAALKAPRAPNAGLVSGREALTTTGAGASSGVFGESFRGTDDEAAARVLGILPGAFAGRAVAGRLPGAAAERGERIAGDIVRETDKNIARSAPPVLSDQYLEGVQPTSAQVFGPQMKALEEAVPGAKEVARTQTDISRQAVERAAGAIPEEIQPGGVRQPDYVNPMATSSGAAQDLFKAVEEPLRLAYEESWKHPAFQQARYNSKAINAALDEAFKQMGTASTHIDDKMIKQIKMLRNYKGGQIPFADIQGLKANANAVLRDRTAKPEEIRAAIAITTKLDPVMTDPKSVSHIFMKGVAPSDVGPAFDVARTLAREYKTMFDTDGIGALSETYPTGHKQAGRYIIEPEMFLNKALGSPAEALSKYRELQSIPGVDVARPVSDWVVEKIRNKNAFITPEMIDGFRKNPGYDTMVREVPGLEARLDAIASTGRANQIIMSLTDAVQRDPAKLADWIAKNRADINTYVVDPDARRFIDQVNRSANVLKKLPVKAQLPENAAKTLDTLAKGDMFTLLHGRATGAIAGGAAGYGAGVALGMTLPMQIATEALGAMTGAYGSNVVGSTIRGVASRVVYGTTQQEAMAALQRAATDPQFARFLAQKPSEANALKLRGFLRETAARGPALGFAAERLPNEPPEPPKTTEERYRELMIKGPGNRPARASGGAVNLNALAKVAKKHVTTSTEQLLNQNDDTVARALEIANKNI
jgi:hypothetical protein